MAGLVRDTDEPDRSGPTRTLTDAVQTHDTPEVTPVALEEPEVEWDVGALIGRYVVIAKLGSGAMGVVYAAYDPELDRKVALKLLRTRGKKEIASNARLQREAQALARLNHRNVVTVHDVGVHADRVFVAMEFLEGETLRTWMRSGGKGTARPWREVLPIFEAAGEGLAAAHAAGLVHRDFKPDNVMLSEDRRAIVMDFGLARPDDDESGDPRPHQPLLGDEVEGLEMSNSGALGTPLTVTGAMMGTPAYMAPEQFAGTVVTSRTDQFGFCVALYEALYGTRPFGRLGVAQLMMAVTEGRIEDPPAGSDFPQWLRKVVLRGLSPNPNDRHPTIGELLTALRDGEGRGRRRRRMVAVGAIVAVAAGVAGIRQLDEAGRVAACEAEGETVAEVWADPQRQQLRDAFASLDIGYASDVAERVIPWLDERAAQWQEQATEACLARDVRGTMDAQTHDKATWCLGRRRTDMQALVTALLEPSPRTVSRAVQNAASLDPAAACGDTEALAGMPDPPAEDLRERVSELRTELSRIRALTTAGKVKEALGAAAEARAAAREIGWPPLLATALALESGLLSKNSEFKQARELGVEAYTTALAAKSWIDAAAAGTNLVYNTGVELADHEEGLTWGKLTEVALEHSGDPTGIRRARLDNNLGSVRRSKGDWDEAKRHYDSALARYRGAFGPKHPRVGAALNNLGNLHGSKGQYVEAREYFVEALAVLEATLGPKHPSLSPMLNNLANASGLLGEYQKAKEYSTRALTLAEETFGPEHASVASALANLGAVQYSLGEFEESKQTYRRAIELQEKASGPEHPVVANLTASLAIAYQLTGEFEEALALSKRALEINEKFHGPDHPACARVANDIGVSTRALGNPVEAEPWHRKAIARFEKTLGDKGPGLARAHSDLGRTLHAQQRYEASEKELLASIKMLEETVGPDHPDRSTTLGYLGETQLALDRPADSVATLQEALRVREKTSGPDDPMLDTVLTMLGRAQLQAGAPALAIATLERAMALSSNGEHGAERPATRFALAGALWDAPSGEGRDRARARELAEQAQAAWTRRGDTERVAEVETWLAQHSTR